MATGKTVLILRSSDSARRTAEFIRIRGFKPFIFPLDVVKPVRAVIPEKHYNAVLATSANAFLKPFTGNAVFLTRLPLCCVGVRTAQAARKNGFGLVACISKNVDELCNTICINRQHHYIYLAGKLRRPVLENYFCQNRAKMDIVEVYETKLLKPTGTQLSRLPRFFDFVLIYSSRTAENLVYFSSQVTPFTRILCLSGRIARSLPPNIRGAVLFAADPTEESLLSLLDRVGSTPRSFSC